jgi:hypothetical protein
LAARNLLVTKQDGQWSVKIADFGLSKSIENDVYQMSEKAKFPVKWSAPVRLSL